MTAPNSPQPPDANAFLMATGKSMKGKSAKFPQFGASITGYLAEAPRTMQSRDDKGNLETWDNGDPKWQIVVELRDTGQHNSELAEDDGHRFLFLRGSMKSESKSLFAAVRDAVQAAGAPGLEVGGWLGVTYVEDGPKSNPMYSAPKRFEARYVAPAGASFGAPEAPQQDTPAAPTAPTPPTAPAAPTAPAQPSAPAAEQTPAAANLPADRPGPGEDENAAAERLGLTLDVVRAIGSLPQGWDDPSAAAILGMARATAGAR